MNRNAHQASSARADNAMAPLNVNAIPAELRERHQWVCWKYQERKGKLTKVPKNPRTGGNAMSNEPSTWTTFDHALEVASNGGNYDGIGFMFSEDDDYVGFDLDACIRADGEVVPVARTIIESFDSYSEISPSGKGIKFLIRGQLPNNGEGRVTKNLDGFKEFGVYRQGRFFTVTANHLPWTPTTITEGQDALDKLFAKYFPARNGHRKKQKPKPDRSRITDDDEVLLQKARAAKNGDKFVRLYDQGDLSGHADNHSQADQALCNMLAFWTGGDESRIDRLFRGSALMRPKLDEPRTGGTYGSNTIRNAVENAAEFYDPGRGGVNGSQNDTDDPSKRHSTVNLPPSDCTDVANARRLVDQHGDDLRYCQAFGWMRFDGKRWTRDQTGEVTRRAIETAASIYGEAAQERDEDKRKRLAKHAIASESHQRIKAAVALAENSSRVAINAEAFDLHPWLLNVANGTIDLQTGELRSHRRDDLLTALAPVAFDKDANAPRFEAFIDDIMGGSDGLVGFLKRAVGYSLSGQTSEQCLFLLHGDGQNGKSTLLTIRNRSGVCNGGQGRKMLR